MLLDKLSFADKPYWGHQRAISSNGSYEFEEIFDRKPAVVGFPLNDLVRSMHRPNSFTKHSGRLINACKMGQIVELDWHCPHPLFLGEMVAKKGGGYRHDKGNPEKNIETCLTTPLFYEWLDYISDFILEIESEGGELLFRPFHEMNLAVFWWGREYNTPSQYQKLFQTVVNYLRGRGCKNYFVFAPNRHPKMITEYELYYPGDEFVDVCGLDLYSPVPSTYEKVATFLDSFAKKHKKVLAYTECGSHLGGFQKLTPEQKDKYFENLLKFLSFADFKYIRFWTMTPFVPTEEPELSLFKEQFLPHVQLLN